jgi:hypothetical protein
MNSSKKGEFFFKLQCNIGLIALKDVVSIAHILIIFPPKSFNLNPPMSYKDLTIKEKILLDVEDIPIVSMQKRMGNIFHS